MAIYLFTMETWGRYIYLALAVAIFLLTALRNGGCIRVKLYRYHAYVLAFVVYTGFSAVWAWAPAEAFSKCITLLNIFICCAMMYPYYAQQDSAEPLLSIFMWAGYLGCALFYPENRPYRHSGGHHIGSRKNVF